MIPGNSSSQGKYVDPPTSVSASAGNAQATVSFTLPVYDGKGVATYVATSSPSSITGSGATSPITITGLNNGTSYTFTVTTISGYGVSATSSASNSVTPVAPTTTTAAPPPPPPPTSTSPPDPCLGSPAAGTVFDSYCLGNLTVVVYSDGCHGQNQGGTLVYGSCGFPCPGGGFGPGDGYCAECGGEFGYLCLYDGCGNFLGCND